MDRSESISQLTAALAKAQGEFKAVPKLGKNPFLKSEYVRLDDIIAAIRGPLSKNGIAWTQPIASVESGLVLETLLLHDSGEWMSSTCPIPQHSAKGLSTLQATGVSLSYMRRYMLTTMLGINSGEDTDGNGDDDGKKPARKAAAKRRAKSTKKAPQKPADKAAMHEAMADAIAPEPASLPKAVAPEEWDTLPVPENYTDLYYRVHELGIDDADDEKRRFHAAAIIKKTYPDNGASAADAWQAIITYQQAKLADADGAE